VAEPPEALDSVVLSFEGAHEGNGAPDPETCTGWQTELSDVDCHRYVRFKAEFKTWSQSAPIPELDTLTLPYTYQP